MVRRPSPRLNAYTFTPVPEQRTQFRLSYLIGYPIFQSPNDIEKVAAPSLAIPGVQSKG